MKFERNNSDIALTIFYAPPNKKEIKITYKSKFNRKRKNQVVLLMITDDEQQDTTEKWHYIALNSEIDDDEHKKPTQSLSALYRGVASNHNGDFLCLDISTHIEQIMLLKNMRGYAVNTIIAK